MNIVETYPTNYLLQKTCKTIFSLFLQLTQNLNKYLNLLQRNWAHYAQELEGNGNFKLENVIIEYETHTITKEDFESPRGIPL